ncbi:MAG TPA: flagellin, partial [Lacipirellulaceae bacterium]|nr:flagellin [Lacipirellulaceae bacterium]
LDVNLAGATTVQQILDAVNNHPLNNTGGVAIVATLTPANAIQLTDVHGRPLRVLAVGGSAAAEHLGLVAPGGLQRHESSGTIAGGPIHYPDSSGVFATLTRLREAIASGDVVAMERAIGRIDEDIRRSTFAQAEVGARQRALEITQRNLEDEDVQLRQALSNEIEVDLVEAISNLTARQASLQASLQTMATMMRLSLLDYL